MSMVFQSRGNRALCSHCWQLLIEINILFSPYFLPLAYTLILRLQAFKCMHYHLQGCILTTLFDRMFWSLWCVFW